MEINFKKVISGDIETVVASVTEKLKEQGFGVLNRIDLHSKIKEKLQKEIPQTVILGACNPQFAYDAFLANSDVTSLLPCNAVIRDLGDHNVSVELAKPSTLLKVLGDEKLISAAVEADRRLKWVIDQLR